MRQGYEIMLALCRGSARQKAMAQDALNRWWWPSLMMFGPHDAAVRAFGAVDAVEAEARSRTTNCGRNSSIRRVPQADIPRHLVFPIRICAAIAPPGHYDFGPIDWDEFQRVVNGDGPCNRQRLAHHAARTTTVRGFAKRCTRIGPNTARRRQTPPRPREARA